MKLYTAFDLHSNNSYLGIAGIAVESTYNWYWLVDMLMTEGYKVEMRGRPWGRFLRPRRVPKKFVGPLRGRAGLSKDLRFSRGPCIP